MVREKTKWILAEPRKEFEKFFKTHFQHTKFIPEFESDVTENPYYHPRGRIKKLAPQDRYPKESYRWKKSDLRIVYAVEEPTRMIFPLDINVAGSIGYRRK